MPKRHGFSCERSELPDDFRRAVPVAAVPDVDQSAVGGLQRVARVEVGDAVGADHLPVGAAGKHAPGQPLAGEAPAGDADDAPAAERRVAQLLGGSQGDFSFEELLEIQFL